MNRNSAITSFIVTAAALLSFTTCVGQTTGPSSDASLPRDPNNIYGVLENSVHYIVRSESNPPGKVSLDLHVRTGAFNETDAENGLAHFLEHMAFKGSDHFAPMKLIPLLSHMGMTFGADTNAHTNQVETVFKLSMPDNSPETIKLALTIFGDYANALKLYPLQLDSERRVILEEARSHKGAAQRLNKRLIAEMFPDTRLATHDVIGDESQIKSFQQPAFEDYWNTWYRPENMTLIVVGDVDANEVIADAKTALGNFRARGPAREPATAGLKPFDAPRAIVLSDPEQVTAMLSMDCLEPSHGRLQTVSQYRQQVLEDLAQWIVNRRITSRIARGGAPFRSANVGSSELLEDGFDVTAEADGDPKDWHGMLDAAIDEIHRAVDYGFTPQEIALAERGMLAGGEWAVKTEPTKDSKTFTAELASLIGAHKPILSAQQKLNLTRQALAGLTPAELQHAFNELFDTRNFTYALLMPAATESAAIPTRSDVLAAASAAWDRKPEHVEQSTDEVTILPGKPAPGAESSRSGDPVLGVTTIAFKNGVVMHHKFIDAQKDQVLIQITLPGGPIEETADTKGLSSLAGQILTHPATHRLNSTQIRDLMVGQNVTVAGGFAFDSLKIGVGGAPADLPTGLQLVNALLTDAVLEQPAFIEWKKTQLDGLRERKSSASAQLAEASLETVGAGDLRLSMLTPEIVNRLTADAAEAWFNRIAHGSAVEVAVVGDIQLNKAVDLVGRYLGSLPKRTGTFDELDSLRKLERPQGPFAKTVRFPGVTPKAVVLAGYVGCEENDPDRRPLALASIILTNRMIQRIRVEDNLVYSINCTSTPGQGLPGLGQIAASAPTDPQNADRLATAILDVIKSLSDTGPTDDELETAKSQIANSLGTQMKEPDYWLVQLSQLNYHKRSLDALRELPDIFQSFTAFDVQKVLWKYVAAGGEIRLEAVPDSAKPSAAGDVRGTAASQN